jgi:CheY-like chemotaxis protein
MGNILVIDDDQEKLDLMDVLLTTKGLTIKTESQNEKTFNQIESLEPDVIVMDIDLGKEDGRIITRQIESSTGGGHLPVIILSDVKDIDKKIGNCLNDDFISKPFEAEVFHDKIEHHLHNFSSYINEDNYLLKMMKNNPVRSIDLLYDKYSPALYAYILSIVEDKDISEKILICIFTELAGDPEDPKKEKLILKLIRKANKAIVNGKEKGWQSFLPIIKNLKHIQNNQGNYKANTLSLIQ